MTPQQLPKDKNIPPIFLYDENIRKDHPVIAGLDEAGRGSLAGPVVAASVILESGLVIKGIRDSKKIRDNERRKVFWEIVESAVATGVGIVDAETIDKINILQSTRRAMRLAVEDMGAIADVLLIDAVELSGIGIDQRSIIKGESFSASIAAASIIAKVVRDDIMLDYHDKYPDYNFKVHKGYLTREHMGNLNLYGPCPIHRKSFRKVMDVHLPF